MSYKFDTLAIHAGQPNEERTGAVTFPIFQTSTFGQLEPGVTKGFSYGRTDNPTRRALEECVAALEGGGFGIAFASGLAAASACLQLLRKGDHVVAGRDLYGGIYRLFTKVYRKFGLEFTFADLTDPAELEKALRPATKQLWLETPSNPLLRITDIAAASARARERGALVVADNTFATPYLQKPLDLGADIVLHSTTKYLNGHSDVIGGLLAPRDPDLAAELRFYQNAVGAVPGPQDCFLTLRGIKTLGVRMDRHCRNAARVAEFLSGHPKIERVHYPGLPGHPGHEIASRQQRLFGAMVSLELRAGLDETKRFATLTRLFTLAESLGSVKSLLCHPPTMTHASVEPEVRKQNGIPDGIIRLSVGIIGRSGVRPGRLAAIVDALSSFAPLRGTGLPSAPEFPLFVHPDPDRPQPLRDAGCGGGMTVSAGRVRPDHLFDFRFTLVVNNLVRGASGAAVLNAELAVREGYVR